MKFLNIIFIIFTEIVLLVNSNKTLNRFLPNLPIVSYILITINLCSTTIENHLFLLVSLNIIFYE